MSGRGRGGDGGGFRGNRSGRSRGSYHGRGRGGDGHNFEENRGEHRGPHGRGRGRGRGEAHHGERHSKPENGFAEPARQTTPPPAAAPAQPVEAPPPGLTKPAAQSWAAVIQKKPAPAAAPAPARAAVEGASPGTPGTSNAASTSTAELASASAAAAMAAPAAAPVVPDPGPPNGASHGAAHIAVPPNVHAAPQVPDPAAVTMMAYTAAMPAAGAFPAAAYNTAGVAAAYANGAPMAAPVLPTPAAPQQAAAPRAYQQPSPQVASSDIVDRSSSTASVPSVADTQPRSGSYQESRRAPSGAESRPMRGGRGGRGSGRGGHSMGHAGGRGGSQPTPAMPINGAAARGNYQAAQQQMPGMTSPQMMQMYPGYPYANTGGYNSAMPQGSPGQYSPMQNYAQYSAQVPYAGGMQGMPGQGMQTYMPGHAGYYGNAGVPYQAAAMQAGGAAMPEYQPSQVLDPPAGTASTSTGASNGSVQRASATPTPTQPKAPRKKEALDIVDDSKSRSQSKAEAPAGGKAAAKTPSAAPAGPASHSMVKQRSKHVLEIVEPEADQAKLKTPAAKAAPPTKPAAAPAAAAAAAPPAAPLAAPDEDMKATAAAAASGSSKSQNKVAEAPAKPAAQPPAAEPTPPAAVPKPTPAPASASAPKADVSKVAEPATTAPPKAEASKPPAGKPEKTAEQPKEQAKEQPKEQPAQADTVSPTATVVVKPDAAPKAPEKPAPAAAAPVEAPKAAAVPDKARAAPPAKPAAPAAPTPPAAVPPPPTSPPPAVKDAVPAPKPPPPAAVAPPALADTPQSVFVTEQRPAPPPAAPRSSDSFGLKRPYKYTVDFLIRFTKMVPPNTAPITSPKFDIDFKTAKANPRFSDTIFNLMAAMQSRGGGSRGGGGRNRDDRGQSRSHQSISLDHQHSGNWERAGHHPGGGRDDRRGPPRDDRRSGGDQWERGRNFHAMAQPAINLHKTESQYMLKSYKTDDPNEEQKQRDFTSFLNKLTPDNFERLIKKICSMEITGPQTLKGFVDQIFQKALVETIFCELYAKLCHALFERMPKFEVEEGGQVRKYNVRTIILEKCQEEFEKGSRAALAQKKREAREKEAAAKAAEGGVGSKSAPEATLTPEEDLERRRKEMEEAAAEVAARKRALGNMQFIGFLFKQSLLTETVLHTCIQELLNDAENPKPEDLECAAKLLQTTGANLEVGKHPQLFKAYFARIQEISKLKTLDSRIRFMLIDLIELRERHWHARREAEGPKKIEEIHREAAAQEQQARRNAAQHRQEERRRGGPMDHHMGRGMERPRYQEQPVQPRVLNMGVMNTSQFGPRGGMGGRGARGGGMMRQPSAEVSLRPGGMGGRGMANGMVPPPAAPPPVATGPSPSTSQQASPVSADSGNRPTAEAAAGAPLPDLDRDKLQTGIKNALGEYSSHNNMKELLLSLKELVVDRGAQPSSVLCFLWLAQCNVHKSKGEYLEKTQTLTQAAMEEGEFASQAHVVPALERLVSQEAALIFDENSLAKELLAHLFAQYIFSSTVTFKQFVEWVTALDPEDPEAEDSVLVDSDHAAGFVAALLACIKDSKGEATAKQMWDESGASVSKLFPSYMSDDVKQREAARSGLSWVL